MPATIMEKDNLIERKDIYQKLGWECVNSSANDSEFILDNPILGKSIFSAEKSVSYEENPLAYVENGGYIEVTAYTEEEAWEMLPNPFKSYIAACDLMMDMYSFEGHLAWEIDKQEDTTYMRWEDNLFISNSLDSKVAFCECFSSLAVHWASLPIVPRAFSVMIEDKMVYSSNFLDNAKKVFESYDRFSRRKDRCFYGKKVYLKD